MKEWRKEREIGREGGKEGRGRQKGGIFFFFLNWTWNRDETKRWSDKICGDPLFLNSTNRRQKGLSNPYKNETMSNLAHSY